jgi:hypothetical protein
MKFIASMRFEKVFLFLPKLSVKAIEFLFDEIELTGKLTEISCPFMLYDIGHTPSYIFTIRWENCSIKYPWHFLVLQKINVSRFNLPYLLLTNQVLLCQ